MKTIDEHYKDWCGEHHTINSAHPVHDSAEACDFARYYFDEKSKESAGGAVCNAYYGVLSSNDRLLTVVKVIDGSIIEKRMIQITFCKSFLEKKDYKNAFLNMSHTTSSFYNKEQLKPGCDKELFDELYSHALKLF